MALSFTSWSFDAASYAPGATVTLTVGYASTDVADASDVATAVTVTLANDQENASQVSDESGNFPSFTTSTPGNTPRAVTVSATDTRGGTWTVVSNDLTGDAAPFAGIAVLTSIA